ncbi:MAG: TIGR01777 family protein [Chloroflexaceae bacterium]|nr:TIGR01777 family protein [Chloroflexaceae bacterium]NJL34574.1 TIGR01777 family protein [Chloroflexaceae bacterium]NJO06685.1 TIGR01777 family protein [Chloroflexaceae bacterium]
MSESTRIVVTGATGTIGSRLSAALVQRGYQVTVFSRRPDKAVQIVPSATNYVGWTPEPHPGWVKHLEGAYGVVHLAGAPIYGKRWDDNYKNEIYNSRVQSTKGLVEAMASVEQKPRVFVCGSGVGYYGDGGDKVLDESMPPGNKGWLTKVTIDWEAAAIRAEALGIRTVMLRTGIVLDAQGGALPLLKMPFMFFGGGPVLPGTQWFPWIHIADQVGIIIKALEDERVSGPINVTAPKPLTNRDFSAALGTVMGSPAWFPVPHAALWLVFGELADTLVTGQRALPTRIRNLGYHFQFTEAETALRDLLKK